MVRYPQELIRRRTRQDLLRQRQQELRRRIEQPTPEQPQATQQEIQEYEKLKQQWDEQQSKLQDTISNVEREFQINLATFQRMQEEIRRKEAANPEYTPRFDRRRAAEYANRADDLKIRLGILQGSQSLEEASIMQSYYTGSRREELGRQAEQRIPTPSTTQQIPPTSDSRYVPIAPIYKDGKRVGWEYYDTAKGTTYSSVKTPSYRFTPQIVGSLGEPILTAREETALGGGYLSSLYSQTAMTERQVAESVSGVQPQYITQYQQAPSRSYVISPEFKKVGVVGGTALVPISSDIVDPSRIEPTGVKRVYADVMGAVGTAEHYTSKYTTKPVFAYLERRGITKEMIAEAGLGRPELQPSVFGLFSPQMQVSQREIQRGMVTGVLEDVEERPLQNILLWGTGRVVGYSIVGAEKGLKVLGVGEKAIGVTKKVAGVGVGSLFFVSTAAEFKEVETPEEVGEKLGVIGKDITLFGWGMKEPLRRGSIYRDLSKTAEKLSPEQQKIFWETYKEAQKLRGIKPEVRTLDLSRLEPIESKPKAQEYLKKYFEGRKDVVIGGSVSQQSQFERGIGGTKRPSDIDVYIKGGAESVLGKKYARDIAKGLRDVGVSAYAKSGKVSVKGEKFIEFHSYKEFLKPNIEQVTPIYFPARMGLTKTPEGVKILRLGIQAPRKVIGFYLEPVQTGKVRLKDLPAYETIKESLLKTRAKAQKEPTWISYGEKTYDIGIIGKDTKIFKDVKIGRAGGELKPSTSYKKISDYVSYKPYKPIIPLTSLYYAHKLAGKPYAPTKFFDIDYTPKKPKQIIPLIPPPYIPREEEPKTPPPPSRDDDYYTPPPPPEEIITPPPPPPKERKGERIRPERGIRNIPTGWPEPKLFKIKSFGREGYDVGIIINRKPVIIRRGLNLPDARDYGTERVLKDLRATFFIVKSKQKAKDIPDTGAFGRYRKLLRQPLPQSSYKKLGEEVYIQRRRKVDSLGGRLAFKGEVAEIMAAKRKAPSKKQKKKLFRWLK